VAKGTFPVAWSALPTGEPLAGGAFFEVAAAAVAAVAAAAWLTELLSPLADGNGTPGFTAELRRDEHDIQEQDIWVSVNQG